MFTVVVAAEAKVKEGMKFKSVIATLVAFALAALEIKTPFWYCVVPHHDRILVKLSHKNWVFIM